jgi:hypothetical protein
MLNIYKGAFIMTLKVTKTDVWAAEISDKPGELALSLKALADFGADLDCVIARRQPEKPGKGIVFVSPLEPKHLSETPDQAGFHSAKSIATLKVEGPNKPGLGAELTKAIGDAGISMRGLSANVIGHKFVCYVGFDSTADADKAEKALKALNLKRPIWYRSKTKKPKEKELAGVS